MAVADTSLRDAALEVVRVLRGAGHDAFWVGGCVRDQVMGHAPKDYDVASSAAPEQALELFERGIPVGMQFGVVRVLVGEHEVEVATFRADHGYSDGRRPDAVVWSDAREDVLRRDFTINGLLLDPLAGEAGAVVDYVGGLDDIQARVVRAIGDPEQRLFEDKLRMLRAVRFASRFDFGVHEDTWSAIEKHAPDILVVSPERISHELQRILTEGGAERGLELLEEAGLAAHVLPEVDDFTRAIARFRAAGELVAPVGWGTLLYDVDEVAEGTSMWGRRLRLGNSVVDGASEGVAVARTVHGYEGLGQAARKRLLRGRHASVGLAIARRVVNAGQAAARGLLLATRDAASWSPDELRPAPLVTGRDLIGLGFAPGPAFKRALTAVEDAQLEGRCADAAEALDIVRAAMG